MLQAVVFPGQGSQHTGMIEGLFKESQNCKDLFNAASKICEVNFEELFFNPDKKDQLNLTENTQPALVLASVALFREAIERKRLNPHFVAGHSLGEYSALVAAESISFEDAIYAVKQRGKAMQEAVPVGQGAMLAVLGMEDEQVIKMCQWVEKETNEVLSPANFNSPGQIVISGSAKACDWLKENFNKEDFGNPRRHKFIPLAVSAPFHCSLMMPAQIKMQEVLEKIEIKNAILPVLQNFDASLQQEAGKIKENLIKQVTGAVRWVESIQLMKQKDIKEINECGPGKVLTGLVKKIDSESFSTFNIEDIDNTK
ncbi:MAG: ACP S-malonyltransferase [Bdellovibrionota bacterium]|nr:[acyl-carrier-protein] S-malonyltransferase [Pseudobdellovibrionaceae bacterium]|tara:strand:- start:11059 stop:11997 length:939 start_codon:yes stop_codon:yes gene_type:complete